MKYYCAGMIRSGSTWQYNVTADLLEGCRAASRRGFADSEARLEEWIAEEADAVIKLHEPYAAASVEARAGRARVLYIHRDLRDVAASLMMYEARDLASILGSRRLERIWAQHQAWTSLPGVLIQRYEEMLTDGFAAVEQIASFLGLETSREQIRRIEAKNSLATRRRELDASRSALDPFLYRARATTGRALRRIIGREAANRLARPFGYLGGRGVDPHTHLHSNHIGHGGAGSYRELMTSEEQLRLERAVREITSLSQPSL